MKPVTPEQFAACYGVFISTNSVVSSSAINNWFERNFAEVSTMRRLNPIIFSQYKSLPVSKYPRITFKRGFGGHVENNYNRTVNNINNTLIVLLRESMTKAQLDPSTIMRLLNSFDRILPRGGK